MNGRVLNRFDRREIAILIAGLLFLFSGCSFFTPPARPIDYPLTETTSRATNSATNTRIVRTATRISATPSATPSPTLTKSPTPTLTLTPTQVLPDERFPETPLPVLRQFTYPERQLKILLLGSDLRGNNPFRTDSILLLSLNPQQGTVSLLSIPPALYVNIPDVGMERINSASSFGGAGKMMDTLEYNLGVRPDKFLSVDLFNFTKIIGFLDAIDVYVAAPITDRCDRPKTVTGWCSAVVGLNRMDKDMALWYVRSTVGGESSRLLRAQEVLIAVFSRLISINAVSRIDELYAAFHESVETDLSISDLNALITLANVFQTPDRIRRFSFTATEAVPFTLPGGEYVLLLNQNAAWDLVYRAVFEP